MTSGPSGSFSTNSPASPLSSISLTSPLSPFSPVPGSQASLTKPLGLEVSTGHTQLGTIPFLKPGKDLCLDPRTQPEHLRKSSPRPRPKSCTLPNSKCNPRLGSRPGSNQESDTCLEAGNKKYYGCKISEQTSPQPPLNSQTHWDSWGRLDPVLEEIDQNINWNSNFDPNTSTVSVGGAQQNSLKLQQSQLLNTVQGQFDLSFDQTSSHISLDTCPRGGKVGPRKDILPDPQPQLSAELQSSFGNPLSTRCFSAPQSHIPPLDRSSQSNDLSDWCYSPDICSLCSFESAGPKTQYHRQSGSRPLTYPSAQDELGHDWLMSVTTQSDQDSGKVSMQSHL